MYSLSYTWHRSDREIVVHLPASATDSSNLETVHTNCGAPQAFYSVSTGSSFPCVKQRRPTAEHSYLLLSFTVSAATELHLANCQILCIALVDRCHAYTEPTIPVSPSRLHLSFPVPSDMLISSNNTYKDSDKHSSVLKRYVGSIYHSITAERI